jgi:hypothetical protein
MSTDNGQPSMETEDELARRRGDRRTSELPVPVDRRKGDRRSTLGMRGLLQALFRGRPS